MPSNAALTLTVAADVLPSIPAAHGLFVRFTNNGASNLPVVDHLVVSFSSGGQVDFPIIIPDGTTVGPVVVPFGAPITASLFTEPSHTPGGYLLLNPAGWGYNMISSPAGFQDTFVFTPVLGVDIVDLFSGS